MNKLQLKPERFLDFFHSHKMQRLALLGLFTAEMMFYLPFHMPQLVKSLPFHIPEV